MKSQPRKLGGSNKLGVPRKNRRVELFFDASPQPMWIFDRQTLQFLNVNLSAVDFYGYSRQELLRMRLPDLRSGDEEQRLPEALQKRVGPAVQVEWRQRTRDGSLRDVEITMRRIRYHGHDAVLAMTSDVTRSTQLEAQLLQAQKMEAVGMLAGGIAHDFNNLLTIITGYSQLLLASMPAPDRNRSAVEQIMKAGERAAALTRQLLSFSRRQTTQTKVLDLNTLVGSLAVMLRRLIGEDVDLILELTRDLGQVNADPGQVEQVIMNLTVNSRDAMPRGGTLTIHTDNVDLDETHPSMHTRLKPGSYVMLSVHDTGVGMDKETQARLFEPFFTTKTKERGTGLGLSIVLGIVRQSGGNVEVISEPGVGTTVKVYLPRVEEPAPVESESDVPEAEHGSETILLVEDEDMVRRLVRETLEHRGYKILEAAGAEEAGRIGRTYEGPIHLMITDVVMPKESGRALAARMAGTRPDMKVLFMSGYSDTTLTDPGPSGEVHFLQKPFSPAILAAKVRNLLKPANGDRCRHAGG